MINVGQKYKIVKYKYDTILNGIIVKVLYVSNNRYENGNIVEIVDKSLLNEPFIKVYFTDNGNRWILEENLKSIRSDKLKRLLK